MKKLGGKRKMRNKKLWKNLMLVTTLTVALGTVSATALAEDDVTLAGGTQVTAFASEGDIDGGIAVETQAEQTAPEAEVAPQADTTDAEATTPEATVPEADTTDAEAIVPEQTAPEATAPEVEQAEQTAPEAIVPEEVAPEATAPEADTTVKDEVSVKATAPTINATASSTTFDGTQDIVVTFTITSEGAFEVGGDIPLLGGGTCNATYEKVSDTEHRFTIPAQALKNRVEGGAMKDGQTLVFHTGYGVSVGEWGTDSYQYVDFPDVTLTYTTGDNGDNGNGETPEKPENPDPENPDNGNGETPEKPETPDPDNGNGDNGDNNGGDNGNGETPEKPENPDPENPDNGNGDNQNPDNGGDNGDNQKPENPDNGNGDNQNPDGDNSETPDDNKDVQDWMTLTPAQKVTTTTQTQTPQTQTVSTTQTAPKTGDAASTLPLLGTGLTSLGVALGAIFKKRR